MMFFRSQPPAALTKANNEVNRMIRYVAEPVEDGHVKEMPEALEEGADCETFAYQKANWLNQLGYPCRMIFANVRKTGQAHALCECRFNGVWILDNRIKRVITRERSEKEYDYSPHIEINARNWARPWLQVVAEGHYRKGSCDADMVA